MAATRNDNDRPLGRAAFSSRGFAIDRAAACPREDGPRRNHQFRSNALFGVVADVKPMRLVAPTIIAEAAEESGKPRRASKKAGD
jgi:hypothetical protein